MRRPRVHTDQPLAAGGRVDLEAGPARHLVKVLRLRPGAEVVLFNGDGFDYPAVMVGTGERAVCRLEVAEARDPGTESPLRVVLVQALCKGEKMDWIIQKCTELGVAAIRPVIAARGEVKLDPIRAEKKLVHWRKVAISASEQSGRAVVPDIFRPGEVSEVIAGLERNAACYLLHPEAEATLGSIDGILGDAVIGVGPEGGWNAAERQIFRRRGFMGLAFGPRVLRTETAGAAIVSVLQSRFGDC